MSQPAAPVVTESAPELDYQYAPPPEMNADAALPILDDVPPPEEPAEEFIPQREFDTASLPQTAPVAVKPVELTPVKVERVELKPVEKAEEKPVEAAKEDLVPAAEPVSDLTPLQWEEAVAKMPFLYVTWMRDAQPKLNDGVIEIHTVNESFKALAENRGYGEIEQVFREVLGKPVKVLIVLDEKEEAAEDKNDAVTQLLDKARRLGIDVKIKQ